MANTNTDIINEFPSDQLMFIPLGGCEQFGMNLNVYGYGGKWLVFDCGIGFADEKYPGVDILLPDPLFLESNRKDLLGIVVTHVHEDHIGAIPYLWSRLKCPIYCTPFAAAFLKRKCSEFDDCQGMVIHEINPDQKFKVGPFDMTVIGVTHSTPTTVSFTVETPAGLVVHGNEWNLDPTPNIGGVTNREAFKGAGRKGVLAYIGDSTNAPYAGRPVGEKAVQDGLENVFRNCTGKIIITIFASNVSRMISVVRAATACGRHVAVAGRSLFNFSALANDAGYLRSLKPFLGLEEAANLPDNKIVYIVTGSQGEPRAAMARIARKDYRDISITRGDTAIFSSRAIPGNEREISAVKGDLLAGGIQVISDDTTDQIIHASGHPYRDEINDMIDWVKPHILIPIHGERMHLEAQADLARAKQVPHVIVPENGSVIVLDQDGPSIIGMVETGVLAVEPSRIVDHDHIAMSERRKLNLNGAMHITAVINRKGRLVSPLQISGIGLFDHADAADAKILKQIEDELQTRMEKLEDEGKEGDLNFISEELRMNARRIINNALGFKPKTTVHLVQV